MATQSSEIIGPQSPPKGIQAMPNELMYKIFKAFGESSMWKVIMTDESVSFWQFITRDTWSYPQSRLRFTHEHEVKALYQVSKYWNEIGREIWKVPEKLLAVQRNIYSDASATLISLLLTQLSVNGRAKFTSIGIDLPGWTFPAYIKRVLPNVSTIHIYYSQWTQAASSRIQFSPMWNLADFRDILLTRDTVDLLSGKFDAELCAAACLSKYSRNMNDGQNRYDGSTTFTFTHVLTTRIQGLRDCHQFFFPHTRLAFRFEATLTLNGPANIIIETPTKLIAKFFLPSELRGSFDRQGIYERKWRVEEEDEDTQTLGLVREEADPEEMLEECFTLFSLITRPRLPKLMGITNDVDEVIALVEANDVGFGVTCRYD